MDIRFTAVQRLRGQERFPVSRERAVLSLAPRCPSPPGLACITRIASRHWRVTVELCACVIMKLASPVASETSAGGFGQPTVQRTQPAEPANRPSAGETRPLVRPWQGTRGEAVVAWRGASLVVRQGERRPRSLEKERSLHLRGAEGARGGAVSGGLASSGNLDGRNILPTTNAALGCDLLTQ